MTSGFDDEGFDDDDLVPMPAPESPRMHGDIPITGYNRGEPIPDLRRLPPERWREVLRPLSRFTRRLSSAGVATPADALKALAIVGDLTLEDPIAGDLPATPLPPRAAAPVRGSSRQVNFRLGPEEHARLVEAARVYGLRPGTFARVLTVRGVNAALYEERRDR